MNIKKPRMKIIYDDNCGLCCSSVRLLQRMDWWGSFEYIPGPKGMREMQLMQLDGKIYGGFFAFRQLVWHCPMLYLFIPIIYFPGSKLLGALVYRWIARNRHFFPLIHSCNNGECHL